MRKIIVFLAVSIIAAVGLPAQEVKMLKVKVQVANVRTEPDMSSAVVKQVNFGTQIESRQKIGDWFEIMVTDDKGTAISGYINSSAVDIVGPGEAKPAAGIPQVDVVNAAGAKPAASAQPQEATILKVKVQLANVRVEPDVNSAVVKQVNLGVQLESRRKIGDWFGVVVTDNKGTAISGYINGSVVDVVSPGEAKPVTKPVDVAGTGGAKPAVSAQPQEATILRVTIQVANIRIGPDSNSAIIKQANLGTLLESRRKIGDWFEIMVTDDKGTAISGYLNGSAVDVVGGSGAKPAAGAQPVGGVNADEPKPAAPTGPPPAPTAEVQGHWPSIMIFGRYGSFSPSDEIFKSVYGSGSVLNGEFRVHVMNGFFASLEGGSFKKTGALTLTQEETTMTLLPIDAMVIFHALSGSIMPYAGAGGAVCKYSEENVIGTVDKWGFGFVVCGGVTARWRFLGIDARVKYSSIKVKPLEDEAGLGGLTLSFAAGVVF